MAVKIRVPFLAKRDPNFDNHPYGIEAFWPRDPTIEGFWDIVSKLAEALLV